MTPKELLVYLYKTRAAAKRAQAHSEQEVKYLDAIIEDLERKLKDEQQDYKRN